MAYNASMIQAFQELVLVKFLMTRENYDKYFQYMKALNFEKETELLIKSLTAYYAEYPESTSVSEQDLLLYNTMHNPLIKQREIYTDLFKKLGETKLNSKLVMENFNAILENYYGSQIMFNISESLEDGTKNFLEDARTKLEEFEALRLKLARKSFQFVTNDIVDIQERKKFKPGLKWRINGLNLHLGEIRGKTLGHIFARVDTGKTSFVISEESYWLSQLKDDECILHLNNEEDGEKLMERFYQAFLNVSKDQLIMYPDKCRAEFLKRGGDRLKLYDEAIINIEDIEAMLEDLNVRVVVVDQADKLHFGGESKLGDVQRLQMIYAKLRELAKKYDVHILTVGQASQTAENKKWLMPTDLDSSKTLKPGEFDYIIGVGKVFSDVGSLAANTRYIHLCKNKLGTGQHAQLVCIIDTARALYYDMQGGQTIEQSAAQERVVSELGKAPSLIPAGVVNFGDISDKLNNTSIQL